jgi:hypothetical protein
MHPNGHHHGHVSVWHGGYSPPHGMSMANAAIANAARISSA